VVAIGTGGKRYAKAFIKDESVPFEVLLDEDGEAAEIVGTKMVTAASLIKPSQVIAGTRALLRGNTQHNTGRRPFQLGATLVIAPGDQLLYEDFEDFAGDHADLDEVLAALRSG
jgi:hypothetical protein